MEAINDSTLSFTQHSMYTHPTMSDYYAHLTPFITLAMFISILLFILNLSICTTTVFKLKSRVPKQLVGPTAFICFMYPVISLAAVVTIAVPKSWLVCHTVMHLCFTVAAVAFQRLCFRYVDSEANFLKETDGVAVTINTPPCCCCCTCLPALIPGKAMFGKVRYMVWQMPFVQGSIMMVLNGIYYREPKLYADVSLYFIPFIVTSILIGLWALNITARMVHSVHPDYALKKKMLCLQLILLFCKLQYLILESQLNRFDMGGGYPINHTIYKQTIINLLILVEMVFVSILAFNAFKTPVLIAKK